LMVTGLVIVGLLLGLACLELLLNIRQEIRHNETAIRRNSEIFVGTPRSFFRIPKIFGTIRNTFLPTLRTYKIAKASWPPT